ncbi:DUF418 domain-containing protein [Nocardia concava]|uniref:DUF418 domain-containing protein n=1 Tax=Nocardia concava TaxID=257281 RepID=UPI000306679C|nr:DUF418 domain-containing protein [Nocardia concava]
MADAMNTPVAAPGGGRIGELDILRGFALYGIVVVNTVIAATVLFAPGWGAGDQSFTGGGDLDRICQGLVDALFTGKFYLLFAFLFGYSFTLQMAAAERAGVPAVPRLLRRSLALFLLGLAHVMALWVGEILTLYAVLCVILVVLRKIRPLTALVTGLLLYLGYLLLMFVLGGDAMFRKDSGLAGNNGFTGSFTETLHAQLTSAPHFMLLTWLTQGVPALGMFLLGLAAGKRRLFEDPELLRRWTSRAMALGFGVGAPVSLLTFAYSVERDGTPAYWPLVQELANPFMTLGYIAGLVALTRSPWAAAVARLAPAGRMAASNYIGQSIVMMLLYTGYGLALAGKVPVAGVVAIATATFAAQVWLSAWWLHRHTYGPVEWLLRAATYLSIPAWRKPSTSATSSPAQ